MEKGYQIIELPELARLSANREQSDIAVALLSWLVACVKRELSEETADVEIDVICVTYLGSYPAIGIRYLNNASPDVGEVIASEMRRMLNEKTILEFVNFLDKCQVSWGDISKTLMSEK